MRSARLMQGVETVENQQAEKTFHPKANEEARRLFKRKISIYKLMRLPLVYIDESGDMPRIFGYASAGMRCFRKHDSMSKRRTHGIVALTIDRLLTTYLFDCGINADVFEAWAE